MITWVVCGERCIIKPFDIVISREEAAYPLSCSFESRLKSKVKCHVTHTHKGRTADAGVLFFFFLPPKVKPRFSKSKKVRGAERGKGEAEMKG